MESLMDALAPQARESAAGRYAAACIRDKRIVEGQPLPDLELPDAEGVVRRVSDFIRPGHYTLGEEKMPWPQLLDTGRTSFTTYETSAVPTSILVDGEGRICRLNARGGWLDGVLEEIYGK